MTLWRQICFAHQWGKAKFVRRSIDGGKMMKKLLIAVAAVALFGLTQGTTTAEAQVVRGGYYYAPGSYYYGPSVSWRGYYPYGYTYRGYYGRPYGFYGPRAGFNYGRRGAFRGRGFYGRPGRVRGGVFFRF